VIKTFGIDFVHALLGYANV